MSADGDVLAVGAEGVSLAVVLAYGVPKKDPKVLIWRLEIEIIRPDR